MDFFEAQDRARRRTGRLVLLFVLAVGGTIAATYAAAVVIARFASSKPHGSDLWQPELFLGVTGFTLLVCGIGAFVRWTQLRAGGPAVAELVGGRPVHPGTTDLRERTLLNVVEEMAIASGLPVPAVYVLPGESAINAFAAGYSPHDAAVAVSEGALARLDRDELQGVVAHEFSHILNGDMRLNTRLSALVFGILALSVVGRVILRSLRHVRVSGSSRRGKGGGGWIAVVLAAGVALLVIGWIGHLFGKLIQAAVSRQREFLADASAVQFTRDPSGIGGALKKLGGIDQGGLLDDPRAGEISHFCFAQNFRSSFGGLFATHPPLDQRLRAIDPAWDGKFLPSRPVSYSAAAGLSNQRPPPVPALDPRRSSFDAPRPTLDPAALLATAGQLSAASVRASHAFLAELPDTLREAAHDPARIAPLCYALCLPPSDSDLRPSAASGGGLALVTDHDSPSDARHTADLHAALAELPSAHRLPLLQLATPTLRQLDPAACATLLDTLHSLVHADGIVSPYEFALQKIITRSLGLAARPRDALHVLAPTEVTAELSLALSVAARLDATASYPAELAYNRAAAAFNGLQPPLAYRAADTITLDTLDAAMDRLALTPAPFRKRILAAVATALTADDRLTEKEADLLRALGAALDCPLPPALPVST
jgi:Zn-dependent protease with chaperone function